MKVLVAGTGGGLAASGISTMADQMVRTLHAMGHEATRVVVGEHVRARPNRLNLQNVTALVGDLRALRAAIRRSRPDAVWLHVFGAPTLPAVRALAQVLLVRSARRPVIVQFHAFDLPAQVRTGGRPLRWVVQLLGRTARCLVGLHARDVAALEAVAPRARTAILPNWVDMSTQVVPMPPAPPLVAVFVGSLVARKGVPQLIEAMRLLDDVPLELRIVGGVGDEGEAAAAAMETAAADLVGQGRISFLGPLAPGDVRGELERSHLLVLPSQSEGMPMAMLEAMAAGRAVVVTPAGNMGDVVREARCGVVLDSAAPEAIAAALRGAAGDLDRLRDWGRHARDAVAARYSELGARAELSALLPDAGAT